MRLSRWLAKATRLSRRKADEAIAQGRVKVDGQVAELGQTVDGEEDVTLDGSSVANTSQTVLLLNKPEGYVCSKQRQDKKPTIYELLPDNLQHLTYAGRLDADSQGLVIMTNDGDLIQHLTHPKYEVLRTYQVKLNKDLTTEHAQQLTKHGVELDDGLSKFDQVTDHNGQINVALHEGRNRQIRRSFGALGYEVEMLKRISHGPYSLGDIASSKYTIQDIR